MVSFCSYPGATAQLYTEYKAGSYQERKHEKVLNQRMESMLNGQQGAASPMVVCVTSPPASPMHYMPSPVSQPQMMASPVPQQMAEATPQAVPMAYASKDAYAVPGSSAAKAAY